MGRRPLLTICCSNEHYRIAILEDQLQRTIAALKQKHEALEREQCYLIIETQQLQVAEQKLRDAGEQISRLEHGNTVLNERIFEQNYNAYESEDTSEFQPSPIVRIEELETQDWRAQHI